MKIIEGVENLTAANRGSAVTIGNYDGVHLGHQRIIAELIKESEKRALKSTVITFEPLPREYFSPSERFGRLTSIEERAELLFDAGIEQVICLRFDQQLAKQSPDEFVRSTLVEGLDAGHLVIGDDFKFGCNREGDYAYLQQVGEQHGFTVNNTESFEMNGVRVSSNAIRQALDTGDISTAEHYLGRPFMAGGPILKGDQLGHTIGFPTANVDVGDRYLPISGVFAVVVCIQESNNSELGECRWLDAVANIGSRPTVNGRDRRFEVHILDFEENVYGKNLKVRFIERLRDEQKFDGLDELVIQINSDVNQARELLKQL